MKLRITSRMRAGFAAMSVLLLAGGLVTVLYTYRVQTMTQDLLARNFKSFENAETIELAIDRMAFLTTDALLHDAKHVRAIQDIEKELQGLLQQLARAARAQSSSELQRQLASLLADYSRELNAALEQEQSLSASKAYLERASTIATDMHDLAERLEIMTEGLMYADLGQIDHSNRGVRVAMYLLGGSGVLLGYFLGMVISRSITNPIYELVLKVQGATGGEVVERLEVPQAAELEDLDQHVQQLIERISTTRADLEKSHRSLQRSERLAALGRVSAGVAHEIRNPLTSIKMLIYSMKEDERLDEEQRKDLAVIVQEVDRLDRFVDNFLKFARPPDPKLGPVDLNQVLHEALDLLMPRLQRTGIRLVEDYQTDLGTVPADADQIKQVIVNLVLNALDAMPQGGSLKLETRREAPTDSDGPGRVQVRVIDTGGGIPEELLDTLFDPFVSGREDGIGLGLAISYQIVRQHRGSIDATSDPGVGTTVVVRLPDPRGQEHAPGAGGGRRGERPLLVSKNSA